MCIHFPDSDPEVVRCAVCIHGPSEANPPKPDRWFLEPATGLKADPASVLVDRLIEGSVCPRCMTSRAGLGCDCSRLEAGQRNLAEAYRFLEQAPDLATEANLKFTVKEAGHVMTSVMKRVIRRMDLSDEELHDLRQDAREAFGIEPKWFPPRTTEPTHLPI